MLLVDGALRVGDLHRPMRARAEPGLGEYLAGHVQGAINLPLDQFAQRIAEVVPNKATPVLLYCLSGARSGAACSHMQQLGYTDVRNGGSAGAVALQLNRPIDRG